MSTEIPVTHTHFTRLMLLLIVAYLLAYIVPIGLRPLAIPDETRYAEIPREMIQSGDWVVPRLVDIRYFEKPALGYWLNAISIRLFGENNFAIRLPSALSMGLSAWFIWLLLVKTGHDRRTALIASAIFLTFLEILVIGTVAILDSPFTLFLTAGTVIYYLAVQEARNSRRQVQYLLLSGIMYGLAFLTKGFLAFALPFIVLFPFILVTRQFSMVWRSGFVVLSAILTVLPWAIAIHLREPDYWHYFIVEEHLRRFLSPTAQHAAPFYYYLATLPVLAFPWFAFFPAAIAWFRRHIQLDPFTWLLILWFVMPMLFFSVSKGKLVTYILPCLAPAAIVIATGVVEYLRSGRNRWFYFASLLNAFILSAVLFALLRSEFSSGSQPFYHVDETDRLSVMVISLLLSIALTLASTLTKSRYTRIILVLCGTGILLPAANFSLPDSVLDDKSPSYIMGHVLNKIDENTILVSDANVVRSVAWTFKRTDILLLHGGELAYGLGYPEHKDRLIGLDGLRKLLAKQHAGEIKQSIAVFCEEPCQDALSEMLGQRAKKMSNDEFAVWYIKPVTK